MDRNTPADRDEWNQRAIPTIPGQRPAPPADTWDAAAALVHFPRQQRPDAEQD
ncbi:hypothetical protein [Streptomyces sp. NPDC047525]|uniref:hypothetical protein n=1 Tax=Streptomyces sp. NPDC047525 TaxID=3155264 RepID=UPI0033DFE263